jgi:shikimate kinase
MATYLLIGPSGSGKSTAAKIVAEKRGDILVCDLDKEIKKRIGRESVSEYLSGMGNEHFFEFSKRTIDEISADKSPNILIVVGAGSINYKESHEWYLRQNLIALSGNAAKIYERGDRQRFHSTLERYIDTEFNDARRNLYENSKYIIDVTEQTPEQVADSIVKAIVK